MTEITFYTNGTISIDHTQIDARLQHYDHGKERFRSDDPRFVHLDKRRLTAAYTETDLRADMLAAIG